MRALNKRFPAARRETCWQSLEKMLGVSLPQLERPPGKKYPRIPRQYDSVVSLTYWIIEHHPERAQWSPVDCRKTGKSAERTWSEEEVWEALCDCISDALGVKREKVTPDARMIEDLGMD